MKKKTLTERACSQIPKFSESFRKLRRHFELSGKSESTVKNYGRCLAHMALHFECCPSDLDRTEAMGGHIDQCNHKFCGKLHLSYNSCRNRHCPKCQGHLREKWIAQREEELLNTGYFHVVFSPCHRN